MGVAVAGAAAAAATVAVPEQEQAGREVRSRRVPSLDAFGDLAAEALALACRKFQQKPECIKVIESHRLGALGPRSRRGQRRGGGGLYGFLHPLVKRTSWGLLLQASAMPPCLAFIMTVAAGKRVARQTDIRGLLQSIRQTTTGSSLCSVLTGIRRLGCCSRPGAAMSDDESSALRATNIEV